MFSRCNNGLRCGGAPEQWEGLKTLITPFRGIEQFFGGVWGSGPPRRGFGSWTPVIFEIINSLKGVFLGNIESPAVLGGKYRDGIGGWDEPRDAFRESFLCR